MTDRKMFLSTTAAIRNGVRTSCAQAVPGESFLGGLPTALDKPGRFAGSTKFQGESALRMQEVLQLKICLHQRARSCFEKTKMRPGATLQHLGTEIVRPEDSPGRAEEQLRRRRLDRAAATLPSLFPGLTLWNVLEGTQARKGLNFQDRRLLPQSFTENQFKQSLLLSEDHQSLPVPCKESTL